jgi:hypothetical protein
VKNEMPQKHAIEREREREREREVGDFYLFTVGKITIMGPLRMLNLAILYIKTEFATDDRPD